MTTISIDANSINTVSINTASIEALPDRELLKRLVRVADNERHLTADLLTLLGECDTRRLYLGEGCSSLFTYCTQVLHFSEHAAYHRIEAARAARQFPIIFEMVANGSVTLTTVALLRPHLTPENHRDLLTAAHHRTKREVEYQIACLAPKPDATAVIRRLPASAPTPTPAPMLSTDPAALENLGDDSASKVRAHFTPAASAEPRPQVTALAADRYLLRVTLSAETHAKLERAQQLMGHRVPDGDPHAIISRALSLLVEHLERAKFARVRRPRDGTNGTWTSSGTSAFPSNTVSPNMAALPRRSASASAGGSRHIPAKMRRQVWARDEGRCAFVGSRGRCTETRRLEFHHVVPFARGGPTSVENLALRCRTHNAYESDLEFGARDHGGNGRASGAVLQEAGLRDEAPH